MVRRYKKGGIVNKEQLKQLPTHMGKQALKALLESDRTAQKYFTKNTVEQLINLLKPTLEIIKKEDRQTHFRDVIPSIIKNVGSNFLKGAKEIGTHVIKESLKPVHTVFFTERLLGDEPEKKFFKQDYNNDFYNSKEQSPYTPPQYSPYHPEYKGGRFIKRRKMCSDIIKEFMKKNKS